MKAAVAEYVITCTRVYFVRKGSLLYQFESCTTPGYGAPCHRADKFEVLKKTDGFGEELHQIMVGAILTPRPRKL